MNKWKDLFNEWWKDNQLDLIPDESGAMKRLLMTAYFEGYASGSRESITETIDMIKKELNKKQ